MAKILIAEDEAINRLYLSSLLDRKHYEYDQASRGADVLDLLVDNHYDLLLLDLGLPDMDGLEILRRIEIEQIQIKVIAVSGRDMNDNLDPDIQERIRGFVAKPIQEFVFFREIERVLHE